MIANNCCREMYIVYGATPSVPLGITGPATLCSSSTGNYTINSLPCNSSVTWSTTVSQITTTPTTGVTTTLNPNGYSGDVNLIATIVNSSGTSQITKLIQIGKPTGVGIVSYNNMELCSDPYTPLTFKVLPNSNSYIAYEGTLICGASNATSISWNLLYPGNRWGYSDLGNGAVSVYNKTNNSSSITLRFLASNGCGSSSKDYMFSFDCIALSRTNNNTSVTISPNPTSGQFNISLNSLDKASSIKEIRIKNKMGTAVYAQKFNNNQKQQIINLYNQPMDIYTVEIYDGSNWSTQKLSLHK